MSYFTTNLGLEVPDHGQYASTGWDTPMNSSLNQLDVAYGGYLNVSVSGGSRTLTRAEASNQVIQITGSLSNYQYLNFPPIAGKRLIIPNCSMNGYILLVRGNNGADGNGIYFWSQEWWPTSIVVAPWRVFWDYGGTRPGTIIDVAWQWPLNGWLPLDGRYVDQALHDILYDLVGTYWGPTSGTSFYIGDFRGMVTAMADNIGTVPASGWGSSNSGNRGLLGAWSGSGTNGQIGESYHTLSWNEMPIHNHTASDSGHTHGGSVSGHHHGASLMRFVGAGGKLGLGLTPYNVTYGDTDDTTPGLNISSGNANVSTGNAGNNYGHNTIQWSRTTMKMVKW